MPSPGANGVAPPSAVGGHLLLKPCCSPTVTVLRRFSDGSGGDESDPPRKPDLLGATDDFMAELSYEEIPPEMLPEGVASSLADQESEGKRGIAVPPRKLPKAVASWLTKNGIGSLVVEKVNVTKLQEEFWMAHDEEPNRNRPHRELENATDTRIVCDRDAGCLRVLGSAEDVKEAVKRIRKSQHIKLKTGPAEMSLAAGNYVAMIRHKFENDDLQLHLQYADKRPGTCELRRLHRVDGEADDAKAEEADQKLLQAIDLLQADDAKADEANQKLMQEIDILEADDARAEEADQKLMQAIDLHEVVLDVPAWAMSLARTFPLIEQFTTCGLNVSKDAIDGRRLVTIAGSRATVKRGTDEIIKRITSDSRYKEGDVRLRRIRGQSVDTAGFEAVAPVGDEDLSNCKESFYWERLTREQWQFVRRSSKKVEDE